MAATAMAYSARVNCIHPVFDPETGLSAEFAGGPLTKKRKAKFLASDEAAFISGVCIEVDGACCV